MADCERQGYYAVIPAQVRYDQELRPNAKLLYGELTALAGADGYCWASDKYFAELFGLSAKTVGELIASLRRRGYIRVEMSANKKGTERHVYAGAFFVSPAAPGGYPEKSGDPRGYPEKCGEGYPEKSGDPPNVDYLNYSTGKKENNPPVSPQGETGEENGKQKRATFPPEHEAYRCAMYLDAEIRKRLPKKKPAAEETLQSWARSFDECRRLDGYDWQTIMHTLIFSQHDDFWQANILSGRKFRQKIEQLMMKMQRGGRAPAAQAASDGYIPEAKAGW